MPNTEDMPWAWNDKDGNTIEIGSRIWSNGKSKKDMQQVPAYAGTVIGWWHTDQEWDEENGNSLYVVRDDGQSTAKGVYGRVLVPEADKYFEEYELDQLHDIWVVHSTLVHGIDTGYVTDQDSTGNYGHLGDRVVAWGDGFSDLGEQNAFHGTTIAASTAAGESLLHVARDDRAGGGGAGDVWCCSPKLLTSTTHKDAADHKETLKQLEKTLSGSPLEDRMGEFDDDFILHMHDMLEQGVNALCDHVEKEHGADKFEEEIREMILATLKQIVPFHHPREVWVIAMVLRGLLMFGHAIEMENELRQKTELTEEEAHDLIGGMLGIAGKTELDPSDKRNIEARMKMSKKIDMDSSDPADAILQRFTSNN